MPSHALTGRDRLTARRGVLEARLALIPDTEPDQARRDELRAAMAAVDVELANMPYPPPPASGYTDEEF